MIYRVDHGRFITDGAQWGESIYNYLNQYIDGLTYETETYKVNFWDLFKIRVTRNGSTTSMYITFPNGSEVAAGGANDIAWDADWYFILAKTDNFMHLRMQHPSSGHFIVNIFWSKDDEGNNYGGGVAGPNPTFYNDIIYKLDNTTSSASPTYSPTRLLNFTTASYKLAFSEIAVISTAGDQSFIIHDLCSCSAMTRGATVTIQGDNYVALDTNTLLLLELEPEPEPEPEPET